MCAVSPRDAGRPWPSPTCNNVKIAETWDPVLPAPAVHVISSAATVELFLNGSTYGAQPISVLGYATYNNITFAPGNLTAVARDRQGNIVAVDTIFSAGNATVVSAALDVPNDSTGTGNSLVADGHDAALVRATIRDADGNRVTSSNATVSFKIISGPGRIIGVGNGDPACLEYNQVNNRSAYHGYARAVVQVTLDCMSDGRDIIQSVDVDGNVRTTVMTTCPNPIPPIIVGVEVDGIGSDSVVIPVSSNWTDSVLAVATGQPNSDGLLNHYLF